MQTIEPPTARVPARLPIRVFETISLCLIGGGLAGAVGSAVHPTVGLVAAIVGGINGLVSGWRGIYQWRRHGALAMALDSTWALIPVAGGLGAHLVAVLSRDPAYVAGLSARQNRHVYRRGARLKPGFAFTVGNVISGAGDVDNVRRRRLITDHEDIHVWQARWFGPFYLVIYGLWAAFGSMIGVLMWIRRGRTVPLGKMVESCSYYLNPFEWWAYSRDAMWPPSAKVLNLGWKKPAARPIASLPRRVRRRS